MKIFSYLFLILSISSHAQNSIDSSVVYKWIKATINIQCQFGDKKAEDKLLNLWWSGKIDINEYKKKLDSLPILPRKSGTAVFFCYNKRHYLITAKHMLFDSIYGNFGRMFLTESPQNRNKRFIDSIDERGKYYDKGGIQTFLMNIDKFSYILSTDECDLGIIDLSTITTESFKEVLFQKGYLPVTIDDIDTVCRINSGENIFIVGYPAESEIAQIMVPKQFQKLLNWIAWHISIPTLSFGTIGNITPNTFNGNIFIYHGFSGGPVILKNKLIGIVSGGYQEEPENLYGIPPNRFYIHRSYIIKSSLIMPLLKKLNPN